MSNHILALGSALYSRLNSQGTIDIYYQLAPQNTTPPYGIIQPQSPGVDTEYVFGDSDSNIIEAIYTVKVITKDTWPYTAWSLYQHFDTAIQGYPITVTGYDLQRLTRESAIEFRDQQDYWHCGSLFKIVLHKQEI